MSLPEEVPVSCNYCSELNACRLKEKKKFMPPKLLENGSVNSHVWNWGSSDEDLGAGMCAGPFPAGPAGGEAGPAS